MIRKTSWLELAVGNWPVVLYVTSAGFALSGLALIDTLRAVSFSLLAVGAAGLVFSMFVIIGSRRRNRP